MAALIRERQQPADVFAGDPEQLAVLLRSCIQGLAVSQAITGAVPPITDTLIDLITGTPKTSAPDLIFFRY
jgi:hypothetical protein